MQPKWVLGLDEGAGAMKAICAGEKAMVLSYISTPTGQVFRAQEGEGVAEEQPILIRFGANRFYVGPHAHAKGRKVTNLDDNRFVVGSPDIKAANYAILTRLAERVPLDRPLCAVVGLPQSASQSEKEDPTDAVKGWLLGLHEWEADGRLYKARFENVVVTTQAIAVMFDWLMTDDGGLDPEAAPIYARGEEVAAASVGFNTMELNVTSRNIPQDVYRSSSTHGVRRLLEMINTRYSLAEKDAMLRRGSPEFTRYIDAWFAEIVGEIEQCWGEDWRRFSVIRIVGGGALLLEHHFQRYFGGKARLAPDPIFAVARGLYKFGLGVEW